MSDVLRFYFDFISHNAYLAWTQLPKLEERFGIEVEPVPVLFAALLEAHGQLGPAEVPAKRAWMGRNVMRKAALLGVPLEPLLHHPYNPLPSLRACSVELAVDERRRLIDGLFRALWVERRHIAEPDVVREVAVAAGLEGERILARTGDVDIKQRLREVTQDAIDRGVFGIPTMIVRDELFFGYDDFPYLELVLEGRDPLTPATLKKWRDASITPSSERTRR